MPSRKRKKSGVAFSGVPDPATFVREALLWRIYCRGNITGCFIIWGAHFNNNLVFSDLATARDDMGDFNETY